MQQVQNGVPTGPFYDALKVLRGAKNWLLVLVLLVLLLNTGVFVMVRFTSVLEDSPSMAMQIQMAQFGASDSRALTISPNVKPPSAPAPPPAPAPAAPTPAQPAPKAVPSADGGAIKQTGTAPAASQPAPQTAPAQQSNVPPPPMPQGAGSVKEPGDNRAEMLYQMLDVWLPILRLLGVIFSVLLTAVLVVSVLVGCAGGLKGVAQITGAMIWSFWLTAVVMPWNAAFPGGQAVRELIPGVLFDLPELIRKTALVTWGAVNVTWQDQLIYYGRFIGWPVAALLLWLLVATKFARGFSASVGK